MQLRGLDECWKYLTSCMQRGGKGGQVKKGTKSYLLCRLPSCFRLDLAILESPLCPTTQSDDWSA